MKVRTLQFGKALSAALFVLLLSVAGLTKALAQSFTVGSLNYSVNDDGTTVTVTGHMDGTSASDALTIPELVTFEGNDYSVTVIGDYAFEVCSGFTGSLTIPNSVTTIGEWAFSDCYGFTGNLTIPNSVTTIGDGAFYYCSGFTGSLTIGNSVTTIGDYAFGDCSGFTGSLTIPNSVTTIGDGAFVGCSGFAGSLTIGNSVTSIGYGFNCSGLLSIISLAETPPTLDYTFYSIPSDFPLYVPCEVVEAYQSASGWNAFANVIGMCSAGMITVVSDPTEGGLVTGSGTFDAGTVCTVTANPNAGYAVSNWTENGHIVSMDANYSFVVARDRILTAHFVQEGNINFADANVKSICVANWDTDGDGELSYPEAAAVSNLGNAFMYNADITSFDELQYFVGLSSIGDYAFSYCSGLTSIKLPNSLISIGDGAFGGCSGLTGDLVIPNSVTTIGSSAFYGCSGFTGDLVIPNSVTTIEYDAFYGCSGFTGSLTIPNSVTSIGESAFEGCSGFEEILYYATNCEDAGSYYNYVSPFNGCSGILTIGENVERIPTSMFLNNTFNEVHYNATNCADTDAPFLGCQGILIIGDNVVRIPNRVFYSSAFKSLTIGNSVTSIGNYAFYGCSGLMGSLTIPNSVTSIGDYAFDNCNGFTGDLTIPNSVTTIGRSAFNYCSGLSGTLTFPGSLTSIGQEAFSHCYSLASILVLAETPPTLGYEVFEYVSPTIPVYVPCGSSELFQLYGGWMNFSNIIGMCSPGTITVMAEPSEGGTVTGSGTFDVGTVCTVTASSNAGYGFAMWTENGHLVSTESTYNFTVSYDKHLTAHFVPEGNIVFADSNVKDICVTNWDTNGDGELSYAEAAVVTNIRNGVFSNNTEITSFEELQYFIGLSSINSAFQGCSNLTGVIFVPSSITYMDNAFVNCSSLSEVHYNATNCISNHGDAFIGCGGTLVIGDNVESIPYNMFIAANFTGSLVIPNSVTSIGSSAFSDCSNFDGSLVIPNSMTIIDYGTFSGCSGFTSITIPNTITDIYAYAFSNCTGIASITVLAQQPPVLGEGVFENVPKNIPVYVPDGTVEAYRTAYGWSEFFNYNNSIIISVLANPSEGGTVSGGGYYENGTNCTLSAVANLGYYFSNWSKDGEVVSTNANYSFIATESAEYVANFGSIVFTTIVDDSIFLIGDTIPIHGTVKDNHNVPVANVDVEIGVTVFGNRRTLETVSDENGEFAVDFIPSSFESGYYTVNSGPIGNADTTAVHDDFDILGMMIGFVENEADTIHYNGYIVCEVTQNDPPKPFVLPVKNKNSIALTNLHVEIISEQPEGSVFNFGTLNLAGFEFGYLPFTVSGTVPTQGDVFQEFMVRVISNEGSKIEFTIMYYCHEATPELNAYPNPIVTTVTRGKSKTLDVTLTNNGTVASGEITVNLPDLEWMSVMDGTTLPSINAGQSSIFTLRLSPDNEVSLGLYEGTIVINTSSGSYVNLSYSITVVSEEEGILLVDVTDEYTTNTNNGNGPHVEGAEVTLTDYYSHETVAHGFTSSTGIFGAEDIPEGWYYLEVDADRHLGYNEIVYISAGTTNRYDIFLPYQGVYFSWSVEETEIIDEYLIELNVEYETDVPVPVLVIDGPSYIPAFESYYDYSFVITNHGLIDATDLTIIPENEMYYLTPLFTYIDTLHAHQSIVVPCRVTHKDPEDCGNWEKTVVQYKYLSGQTKISKSSFTYTLIGGQPCDDELPYLGDGDSGSGFGNNSPRPKPRPRPNEPNNGNGGNSSNHHSTPPITHQNPYVSVRFGVQFSQNMTMTREAFIGTFIVYNNEPSATTDIGLDLTVKDELGIDHTNLFEITVTSMDGIDAIDGTGTMSAASNGMVKIQFIPTRGAAPTVPVDYYFGGNFTFTDPQTSVSHTMHLYPTKITVHPSPDLHLDYFVSPVLYGDNPLTPNVIEPSVPAELAVRIKNVGVGTAKNVMIETAEPVIVNNIQNLLIEINHIGTYVDGEGVQLGLHNIDFGNIESGQIKEGEWLFTSSLLARLISGNVHLVHNDVYGDPRLSLVSHIGIHELTHPIYGSHGTRTTGAHDLLVNDIPDENNYPDSIYFSNGGKTSVSVIESASFDKYVTSHDTIVTLTVNPSRIGWNYGETEDPGRNHYELVSCTRNNDNQIISLSNIWQESMLVPNSGDSLYENKLRFVDTLSVVQPVTYTLVYAGIPSDPYIFFGDEDEYWSNAANWESNVKPYSPSNNVLIDGICQLDEDAIVSTLTVAESQSLTIPEGRILTVSNSLENTTASRLVIEDGGQLMHSNAGAQATVRKAIAAYSNNNNGWYLVAPPLVGNTPVTAVNNMLSNSYDLYYYDEPTYYWMNQKFADNNFVELENGKGYLYANNEDISLEFAGELQNGAATVTVPLSYTPNIPLSGFNLVGNPFAHNVTSYASVNVANGCYQMNEAKDDLLVSEIDESNPLKPAEGFFVKAEDEGASITFNSGRGATANSSGSIRVELVEKGKLIDRLIVKREGEPLKKLSLNESRTKVFAVQSGKEVAIVPCIGNEQPINFKASKNGEYTLVVNTKGLEFNYLHLIDNLTGADMDLLIPESVEGPASYTFTAKTTDYASRFKLVFSVCGDADGDDAPFAFINNGNIIIVGAEAGSVLQIVDVMGRVLVSRDAAHHVSTTGMVKGVYVLRLINGDNVKTQKIVVD